MQIGYDYKALVDVLRCYDSEEDWFEFKTSNSDPEMIGRSVSALSNSSALCEHQYGYLIWGIDDKTHDIVGTSFNPKTAKKGNQEILSWLYSQCKPGINLDFINLEIDGRWVVILEIPAAQREPQRFSDKEYIRIGSTTRELRNYPEKERLLWKRFDSMPYEMSLVRDDLQAGEISYLLDLDHYFLVQNLPLPSSLDEKLKKFISEKFLVKNDNGTYSITVLGALLFARDLRVFPSLALKGIRIILYKGKGKLDAINDIIISSGYAISFMEAMETISNLLKRGEVIDGALRKDIDSFPIVAVREVLANTLIHQDLVDRGAGPMIEIFENRVEGSNPGMLLVPKDRIIDAPPRARNEALASFLRRIRIVEERGSGFDRIEEAMETFKQPSPVIETDETFTRVKLYHYDSFKDWRKEDRLWTVYLSSCLKYIEGDYLTNSDLRKRFCVGAENSASVSRALKEAVDAGRIKINDASVGLRLRKYVPYWA